MQARTVLIWSIMHEREHHGLREGERKIDGVMPIINRLFPGINFFSITGFSTVLHTLVRPALKKLFPDLLTTSEDQVAEDAMTEIPKFLASKGYQWQNDAKWGKRFEKLLEAA